MNGFWAFSKKEFCENWRTYKLLIMGIVFLLFGLMNPFSAKFLPELVEQFAGDGIHIVLAEPTALDSWMQFFKNVPQLGLIVLVIVFSGIMAGEFSRGTLINLLTKGLSRAAVIVSKFVTAAIIWTGVYLVCFAVTYGYTAYFWSSMGVEHLLFAVFCLWLFGILLIAAVLLGGVVFKSSYGSLLFAGGIVVILFLFNMLPSIKEYNPLFLTVNNMALLEGKQMPGDFTVSVIITLGLGAVQLFLAIYLFNRKEI